MKVTQRNLVVGLRRALFGGCVVLGTGGTAWAQSTPQGEQDATNLDAIVVTAQSRQQELQDVPIALQVVDQQLLDDVAADNLGDIDAFVPGLVVDAAQPTQPSFRLRGVETSDFGIGTDPAVGVFVDGVYGGRGGGVLLPFVDVERIEVLKGPQGTLFGRNTAAGAISLVTRRPQDELEARLRLRLGNYGKQYADAMWNLPTGDNSALRFNALFNHSDGWFKDGATGKDLGGENVWATRAAWQVGLGDNTTALVSWDHESLDQNGRVTTGIVPLPAYPQRPPVPVDPDDYLDPRDIPTYSDATNAEWRTFDGVTLIVDHALTWGHLTSTTSWRQYDALNQTEEDGTNRADLYIDSVNTESNETFYQEFKFAGSNARLDWVAGASFFKEDADQTSEVNTNTAAVDNIVRNLGIAPTPDGSLFGFTSFLAQSAGIPVSLVGDRWNERFTNTLSTTAYAAFGDVIWRATDKLNLTFGLRYTRDEKDFTWLNTPRNAPELEAKLDLLESLGFFDALAQMGIPITRELLTFDMAFIDPPAMVNKGVLVRDKRSWSDFSPRFVVDYHFNDRAMVFGSLAKGYKAGGFNALQIGPAFENEDVWNAEVGIKQSFGRFSYNASLFHYRYDNRQSIRLIDPDPNNPVDIPRFVFDTGDLEATGIDFDMRWKVTDAFTLDAQAEWIDSKYKDYVTPEGVDLDGEPTGEPRFTASVGAAYKMSLGDSGDLRLSARHAYRGRTRCNAGSDLQGDCGVNALLDIGEPRERTDVRVGWTSPQGTWSWAVYGNNIFDNQYVKGLNTYGRGPLGVVGATISEPRTYGMEVAVKF
ncbi:MAG: TonB-dependent receptor [Pseudoxanthomonas sp.]|jgi:iron complex outermembrane receptor protein|uniref:TonB-dependent receptor n=1 Tax=Pseudoxanthomonas TaxID=83618 RepID=UPI00258D45DE|nr:TonB-dependent receptor [Pseudoxanthomonas sp.]MCH2093315.1 TonB-dependent receptor [Pseudoxanthomonas sp.]